MINDPLIFFGGFFHITATFYYKIFLLDINKRILYNNV